MALLAVKKKKYLLLMFPLPSELEALSRSYQLYDFSTGIHTLITQSCSRTRLLSKVCFVFCCFVFLKQPDDARLLYDNAFSVSKPDFLPRVQYLSATGRLRHGEVAV